MGLISNSTSFTRYKIKKQLPLDYREKYAQEIRRYAFREIDEDTDDERSFGWVNIMNILDNEFHGEEFFKGEYIAVGFRIDTRKVPSHVLRHYCYKTEQERKAALGKDFLSKAERHDIKEMVYAKLLKRAIPNSRTFDMIWDIKGGQLLFSSLNESICNEFLDLLKKTFDQIPEQLFPFIIAQDSLPDSQQTQLENVSSTNFCQ